MSRIALEPNSSGSGVFTISSPNSNTSRTLTLPDAAGTVSVADSNGIISANGIAFPATQSASANANTLDDYEEGTWTPVIADAASGGNTATLSSATGNYTKIGNLIRVQARIQVSSKGSMTSGNPVFVRGLPFVSANNNTNRSVGAMNGEGCTFSGFLTPAGIANESYLNFQQTASNTAAASLTVANITASFFVVFDVVYQTV